MQGNEKRIKEIKQDVKGKWQEHARKMKGNERNMKGGENEMNMKGQ